MNFSDVCNALKRNFDAVSENKEGALAGYIPELAKVNPDFFSASLVSVDGDIFSLGHANQRFSLQSTSKAIVYSLALRELGAAFVHTKVGVEPTGEAFNSIIELEEKSHRPFNPMINSGAIATTSILPGASYQEKLSLILNYFSELAGRPLEIDKSIFESERSTAHRNRAIAHLMKHFEVMTADIEETLDLYFNQCSVLVDTQDLARMACTFAHQGVHPNSRKQLVAKDHVAKTLSLMFTCGMYDTAGEWAYRVGLPAKSGVSGAIFVVVPGLFGLAVYSPKVDSHGHSVRGRLLIENFASELSLSIFKKGLV